MFKKFIARAYSSLKWYCHVCGTANSMDRNCCGYCGHEFCKKCTSD
ncbi:MAG TPA: hypothetical protein VF837_01860 [Patescibacteria group bacterium]